LEAQDFEPNRNNRQSNCSNNSAIPLSVRRKVLLGIDGVGTSIFKQYLMELTVLFFGSLTGDFEIFHFFYQNF
jgi:hypothetical protein